eukprot:scaffold10022_cov21-Cyclotella_meneghiniana.AAC.2
MSSSSSGGLGHILVVDLVPFLIRFMWPFAVAVDAVCLMLVKKDTDGGIVWFPRVLTYDMHCWLYRW